MLFGTNARPRPGAGGKQTMASVNPDASGGPLGPLLECLLFVAAEPLAPRQVVELLAIDEPAAYTALEQVRHDYERRGGGLQVARVAGGYQLRTRAEYADVVARFLQP